MGGFGMRFAKRDVRFRVIGIAGENQTVDRTVRVLRAWVAADL